jgi:hypothetical protein
MAEESKDVQKCGEDNCEDQLFALHSYCNALPYS